MIFIKEKNNYNIGLDIGTNSIGWAATDESNRLIHIKGNNAIGVRLFKEGEAAAERRGFRTTRRRLARRKWRLGLLNEIFDKEIANVEPSFFARLKQSNVSPKDPNKKMFGNILFDEEELNDKSFHNEFPTIYHLRQALMNDDRKFDIRLIYLAIHHIVKFRGHFLNQANAKNFKGSSIDLETTFNELNEVFVNQLRSFELNLTDLDEKLAILTDNSKTRSDRQRQLGKVLFKSIDKDSDKENKKVADEIIKSVLGMKAKFNVIFGLEVATPKDWSLNFDSDDFDDKIDNLSAEMTDECNSILVILKDLFFAVNLSGILSNAVSNRPAATTISEAMINRFGDHKDHLKMLKAVIDEIDDAKKKQNLKNAYAAYIDGEKNKKITFEDLKKRISKNLDDSEKAKQISYLLDHDYFLPKQRSKENGSIPHQLHQQELDKIIESQSKYYPFLAELNPNEKRSRQAKYKLDELVSFRVPYYVGPMIESNDSNKDGNGKFAWMIRKEAGRITPWNFDEKVDRTETATKFITRMTTTDTYLIGEPVLPKNSLIYQKFVVLNELNNLKINQERISVEQKQFIFDNVMKKNKRISLNKIADALVANGDYATTPEITGTTDQKNLNNGLTTYIDLFNIFGAMVDDVDKQADFEKIIEWSTIFEDQHIYKLKLEELDWLTAEQRKQVAKFRYQGWGRLSKKLLNNLCDENGQRIIDHLWDSTNNFMQIVNEPSYKEAIAEENGENLDKNDVSEIINDLYTSPQNKKAIRQILLVVDDIIKAVGYSPANIMMEFAREDQNNHNLTRSRKRQVEETYQNISNTFFDDESIKQELKEIDSNKDFTDRLFLYFMQGGIDLYSGEPLNIDNLSGYDIDHILPQSFILDNSLDNRVLTTQKNNRHTKEDNLPGEFFGAKMYSTWKMLKDYHLISNKKFNNLTLTSNMISKFNNRGRFINRQLVETRQIIKSAAEILQERYANEDTSIVTVKATLTHHIREKFEFYKNRNVNDYHHAFDAYLTAFVGNWLLQQYPKLAPLYVYGDFSKVEITNLNSFNMLWRFEKDHEVTDGEVSLDKDQLLGYMKKVYRFKKMLVTKEVYTNHGALYKQTHFPAPANDVKSRKLINTKLDRPTDIYGGYTSETGAYPALVKLKKGKKFEYRLVNIPLRRIDSHRNYTNQEIYDLLKFIYAESGKKFNVDKVLISKVYINQLIADNDGMFTINSMNYKNNAQQLVLSDEIMRVLSKKNKTKPELVDAFTATIQNINKYLPNFEIEDENKTISLFKELDNVTEMINYFNDILEGTHCNATIKNLNKINMSSYWGRFIMTSGLVFTSNVKFIYQSPTGLFNRKIKISDID
ncbi:type II CRISPR RNA-guided endonuclease Cas9 [Fructilactobacillus vespulae]|uniref:type II CRISPR RNA-guided endonuclease Cas9 n=1 Tax=Fructilactobacillus vespulae TaxID=1249630 RepID=UPI0039B4A283